MQISTPQGNIHFVYDATGRKWAKSGPEGLRWYVDNAEFLDGKIQHVAFQDGRFVAEYDENGTFQGTYRAEYYRTDHLGNTRLTFSDFNHDMVITPRITSGTPLPYDSEITSENHYYPFGLGHTGPWYASVAPENKYRYNGKEWNEDWGLGLYDFGNRWQDPALGRFTTVDRFAEKYAFQSAYVMAANDPVKFVDVNGDSIKYENAEIQAFVNKYASPTNTTSKGKIKENKNYNAEFASIIGELDASKDVFIFSNDASKMIGKDGLGEFNIEKDGGYFNVIVPDHSLDGKASAMDLFGGRGALLAEEVYHAYQYLKGDLEKAEVNGRWALKPSKSKGFTTILLEADAKIYAASSGLGYYSTSNFLPGYNIPTMLGLIKKADGNRQSVGRLLLEGTKVMVHPSLGSGPMKNVQYQPSYSIY